MKRYFDDFIRLATYFIITSLRNVPNTFL